MGIRWRDRNILGTYGKDRTGQVNTDRIEINSEQTDGGIGDGISKSGQHDETIEER